MKDDRTEKHSQHQPLNAVVRFLFTGVLSVITDQVMLVKSLIDADGLLLTGFKGTSVPDVNRKDIHSKLTVDAV